MRMAVCKCAHTLSSKTSIIRNRVRRPGAKGVRGEWEGTDHGSRESPELKEVRLFGGTVCSKKDHFPTVRSSEG